MSEGYTLEIVVNQFADRYYRLLCTQPADLHRFYLEKSTFSVGDEGEVGTSVSGQDVRFIWLLILVVCFVIYVWPFRPASSALVASLCRPTRRPARPAQNIFKHFETPS